jgi:hypothetical protein
MRDRKSIATAQSKLFAVRRGFMLVIRYLLVSFSYPTSHVHHKTSYQPCSILLMLSSPG